MDMKKVLEQAGLSGNEVKVYYTLLNLGSALAGEITKKSGVNRTNVYDSLERLIEKGLVSFVIQSNRKYFEAANPEKIVKYLEEKERGIQRKRKQIERILPELTRRRKLSKEPQEATIYKGKKGLKSVAEDVLNAKELLAFGAEGKFTELFTHYFQQWHLKREKRRIPVKIIFNEKKRRTKSKLNYQYLHMKFNSTLQETPSTTWIYGDKVAIIVWSEQPIATVIRSAEVAHSYAQFFEVMWKESSV